MRTIETTALAGKNRKANLLLEFPPDVSPGDNGHVAFECQTWDWTEKLRRFSDLLCTP